MHAMSFLLRILVTSLAAFAAAYLLPGVHIDQYITAIILALVLALLNVVVKPVLIILTLPITLFTLGLFLLVINAVIILIASHFIGGFHVNGFWSALFFSILLSIFTSVLSRLGGKEPLRRNGR
jgi:putative membrane protein